MIQVGEPAKYPQPALQQTSDRPPQLSLPVNERSGASSGHSVKCQASSGNYSPSGEPMTGPKTPSDLEHVSQYPPTEPRIHVTRRDSYEFVELLKQVEEGLQILSRSQPLDQMLSNNFEVWGIATPSPMDSRSSSPAPMSRSMSLDPVLFFGIGQVFTNPQTPTELPVNGYFYPFSNTDQSQSCPDLLVIRREDLPPMPDQDALSKSLSQLCCHEQSFNDHRLNHTVSCQGCSPRLLTV